MSEGLLSSSGQMFMIFGTPTWPSSLIVTEARSWRELGIYLNRPLMAALQSLPKVNSLNRVRSIYFLCFAFCCWFFRRIKSADTFFFFSHLPVVCQTGRGVWIGAACHGCLWKSNAGCGNWRETPYVQYLHQKSSWNLWSHIYQSNLSEGYWGREHFFCILKKCYLSTNSVNILLAL